MHTHARRERVRVSETLTRSGETFHDSFGSTQRPFKSRRTSLKSSSSVPKKVRKSSVSIDPAIRSGLSAKYVVSADTSVSVSVSFRTAPVAVCTNRNSGRSSSASAAATPLLLPLASSNITTTRAVTRMSLLHHLLPLSLSLVFLCLFCFVVHACTRICR